MKILITIGILVLSTLFSAASWAGDYSLSVTRKGQNSYKVDSKQVYVHTKYCYEYVYYDDAVLRMDGRKGTIVFSDGEDCQVDGVFELLDQNPGNYDVNISHEEDDWYEVYAQDLFIKTSGCLSLALGEDAILKLSDGQNGTLYTESGTCIVEGVFSQMRL